MRIGVDATSWVNGRGYGRFTRELLRALCALPAADLAGDELILFVEEESAAAVDLPPDRARVLPVRLSEAPSRAASAAGRRGVGDLLRLTRAVRAERPDAFFFPTVYTWFPLPPGLPACVCLHDAIAERFPELTLPTRRARFLWRAKVRAALLQARVVLTVSEHARRDLVRVLGLAPGRVRVTSEAPAAAFRPSESAEDVARAARDAGLPEGARWIVYVGGFGPHKHVDLLVRAHAELLQGEPDVHLLLVGTLTDDAFHADVGRIRAAVAQAGTGERVHWTGFVPDEELRHLHTGALALALPSACEGFGLPAVEAAACGAPVVATQESPLPEVLAGGGIFVPPGDVRALADAFRRLAGDEEERRALGRRALERASALSWPDAARAALDAVRAARGGSA